jgi:hypothetical protein
MSQVSVFPRRDIVEKEHETCQSSLWAPQPPPLLRLDEYPTARNNHGLSAGGYSFALANSQRLANSLFSTVAMKRQR